MSIPLFKDVSRDFLRLGYTVIPDKGDFSKVPFCKFSPYYDHTDENKRAVPRRPVSANEITSWYNRIPNASGLLILASAPKGMPDLVVVDADDPAEFDWVESTFGPTPLMVESGRIGGGRHYYYQLKEGQQVAQKNGQVGGNHIWSVDKNGNGAFRTKVDIKSQASYVVCPGSMHKSGLIYTASIPITEDNIKALPFFDVDKLNELLEARRNMVRPDGKTQATLVSGNHHLPTGRVSNYLRVLGNPLGVIPQGDFAGLTPLEACEQMEIGDTGKCGCPEHPGSVSVRSVTIRKLNSSEMMLSCHKCHINYVYGEKVVSLDPYIIDPKNTESGDTTIADRLVGGRYLPLEDYAPGRSMALRAPQGLGKTHVMSYLAAQEWAVKPEAVILSLSHLVNLSKANASRIKLPHYQSCVGRLVGSMAVVINSLHRVERYNFVDDLPEIIAPDIVFIDESEQVLRALCSGTMGSHEAVAAKCHLDHTIREAKRVICADADLSMYTLNYINNLRPHDPLVFIDVNVPVEWEYQQTDDRYALEAILFAEWAEGKKLFIPTMLSPESSQALGDRLVHARPGAKVAVINSQTAVDYDLSTINDWIGGFDALICTPTMGTGVSIDIKDHFDSIIGIFGNGVGIAQDARQMLHRVRHPKNNAIRFFAPSGGAHPPLDAHAILRNLYQREDSTRKIAMRMGLLSEHMPELYRVVVTDDGEVGEDPDWKPYVQKNPDVAAFMTHYAETIAYGRIFGNECLGPALSKYLKSLNCKTAPINLDLNPLGKGEVKALQTAQKDAKKVVVDAHRLEVLVADEIPFAVAQNVTDTRDKDQNLQVERAFHKEFYGDVTPETLKFDEEGKGRKKVRRFVQAEIITSRQEKLLMERDAAGIKAGIAASHQRHTYFHGVICSLVLKWFGLEKLEADTEITQEAMALATEKIYAHANLLNGFGYTVTENTGKTPIRFLVSVLDKLGLALDSERIHIRTLVDVYPVVSTQTALENPTANQFVLLAKAPKEKWGRRYTLNGASVTTMREMSKQYMSKILNNIADGTQDNDVVDAKAYVLTTAQEQALLADLYAC